MRKIRKCIKCAVLLILPLLAGEGILFASPHFAPPLPPSLMQDDGGEGDDGGDEYDDGSGYGGEEDENGADEYDDGFDYQLNGPGDQYIQISLMPSFPLNFHGKMYVGGAAQLGYRRFILKWLLIGGDLMIGYHPTIGGNIFNFWPITLAVTFQPTAGKFEFPMSIGAGVAFETYRNNKYFPGFVLKPEVGVFYRINESWSAGIGSSFLWMPQRYSESKYNEHGLFLTASISVRYHF